MDLKRFRVTNFRSVQDSGWIDINSVTAFIGVNESGKTNLLVPLWKLKPARDGEIKPTSDYPKRMFGEIREKPSSYTFIMAELEVGEDADALSEKAGYEILSSEIVSVTRRFDGTYTVGFPNWGEQHKLSSGSLRDHLTSAESEILALSPLVKEADLKISALKLLSENAAKINGSTVSAGLISSINEQIIAIVPDESAKTSTLIPRLRILAELMQSLADEFAKANPQELSEVRKEVVSLIPPFLYYSNYGNLDSEIYLPHVVQNMKREDLGAKEAAKSRTLKVLFQFVRLKPDEILELGQDFRDGQVPARTPTDAEIEAVAERKRERSILLQSAGTMLTTSFKEWWRQGDYRFRFEADGNHFRIWVSDDRRPDEVELESRSTGLQWFLSFYLVFLVESQDQHKTAILLLDEPGLSLHPLAQRDLSDFFDKLSSDNQLLYTTHSPFLVDADRLDRVKKVYVDDKGTTKATADLRQGSSKDTQAGASYAVYSALNMTVSESLLLGCEPIIVEGSSDQHYLTAIKVLLISGGIIKPKREYVFPPSGGTKTIRVLSSMLSGRDERLPRVLLDADEMGRRMHRELQTSFYSEAQDRVLIISQFLEMNNAEIEDLIPAEVIIYVIDRWQKGADTEFSESYIAKQPIVGQIEKWAAKNSVALEKGWKVELAKRVKERLLIRGFENLDSRIKELWEKVFEKFEN